MAAERRITSLAKHENPARACNVRAAKVGEAARAGGRDWDALPILMVLEFGDRNGHALGCQKEVGGAYAYAPERHYAVFLFGRLRRWTRDRGRDLTHLSRATGAT